MQPPSGGSNGTSVDEQQSVVVHRYSIEITARSPSELQPFGFHYRGQTMHDSDILIARISAYWEGQPLENDFSKDTRPWAEHLGQFISAGKFDKKILPLMQSTRALVCW